MCKQKGEKDEKKNKKLTQQLTRQASKKLLNSCHELKIPVGEINNMKEVLEKKIAKEMILEETIGIQKTKRIKTIAFKLTS